jgi:hypothetical protein
MADNNPEVLHVQFSDDGAHIRKWAREPFDGSSAFPRAPAVSEEAVERVAAAIRDLRVPWYGTCEIGLREVIAFHEGRNAALRAAIAALSPTTPTEEPQS